jgi:hypothetical protein
MRETERWIEGSRHSATVRRRGLTRAMNEALALTLTLSNPTLVATWSTVGPGSASRAIDRN